MHGPLARRLFQVGFMACWSELDGSSRLSLVQILEVALSASSTPSEILQELLALSEYMERHDFQLPMSIRMQGDIATRCQAFAKALHYREMEYHANSSISPRLVETLVSLHNSLQQPEAALGVLHAAQELHGLQVKLSWLEKLGRWKEALDAYEKENARTRRQDRRSLHMGEARAGEFALGRMRCLSALSEWQQLNRVSEQVWPYLNNDQQREVAPLLAAARWHCQQWDSMQTTVKLIDPASYNGGFFRAVLAVHANKHSEAQHWIDKARSALHPQFSSLGVLAAESYSRAHAVLVKAQQLAELEELIEYSKLQDQLQSITAAGNAGQSSRFGKPGGAIASLAQESKPVAFLTLPQTSIFPLLLQERCESIRSRWRSRLRLSSHELRVWQPMVELRAMVLQPHEQMDTWIKFASLCRKSGRLELTRTSLSKLLPANSTLSSLPVHQLASVSFDALIECPPELLYAYSKYLWESGDQPTAIELLQLLLHVHANEPAPQRRKSAAEFTPPSSHSATSPGATGALETLGECSSESDHSTDRIENQAPSDAATQRCLSPAMEPTSANADAERIPTQSQAEAAGHDGVSEVVAAPSTEALIYPLAVASHEARNHEHATSSRGRWAEKILNSMRVHCDALVEQALLVSNELIRVAILWGEMWHEALEQAYRRYFYYEHQGVDAMLSVLAPLYRLMDQGAATASEKAFVAAHGPDLQAALAHCKDFSQNGNDAQLQLAWERFYTVLRQLGRELQEAKSLQLEQVSPQLLQANNLELAVPGTYRADKEVVAICRFAPSIKVMTSKQRPRRLAVLGSDGVEYVFLLKGHEDLRQVPW
ncbi:hypothetical protein AB1Y20_018699 [Prymnesium parvum]|uniref:Non-specific serine/threonine protein kinase n=1 Tax=Prymnesium parvum TaxID=97485 RepID=A0AB34JQK1_PRYPA